ncbi:MAG: glutathione S-transferase [Gammaproteobacteria bacterium]|nr:MAG: glutathione S-transferase [Gammaproteobacteria bacterium]
MYQLYYSPNACSLATQVVLQELGQPVEIIDKREVTHFKAINPTGAVPALKDDGVVLVEGAAIMFYLLSQHASPMFPEEADARVRALEDIMFANATMHPAYSKLFFIASLAIDEQAKHTALKAAAEGVSALWAIVEQRLAAQTYFGGADYSAADIMLAVYSRWGQYFPVDIVQGERTREWLDTILSLESFQRAIANETKYSAKFTA